MIDIEKQQRIWALQRALETELHPNASGVRAPRLFYMPDGSLLMESLDPRLVFVKGPDAPAAIQTPQDHDASDDLPRPLA